MSDKEFNDKPNDFKHTRGPWWLDIPYPHSPEFAADNTLTVICAMPRAITHGFTRIGDADFSAAHPEFYVSDREEAEANARLMAASPELLTALLEAIEVIQVFHGLDAWEIYRDKSPEMIRWRTLIAKVRDPGQIGPPEACPHCRTPANAWSDHLSDAHADESREEGST